MDLAAQNCSVADPVDLVWLRIHNKLNIYFNPAPAPAPAPASAPTPTPL